MVVLSNIATLFFCVCVSVCVRLCERVCEGVRYVYGGVGVWGCEGSCGRVCEGYSVGCVWGYELSLREAF